MTPPGGPHEACANCGHSRRYHEPKCFQWLPPEKGSPYAYRTCGCSDFKATGREVLGTLAKGPTSRRA